MTLRRSVKNPEEAQKNALFQRVWSDDTFAQTLEDDPVSALAEFGWSVPDEIEISVVRDTPTVRYLHVPCPPANGEVSDADLMGVQGGTSPFCVTAIATLTIMIVSLTVGVGEDAKEG